MTVEIVMLHTPGCRSCEQARHTIESVAEDFPVEFKEKDLTEHPELAAEHNVMSAPGIVIDGELVFQGGVSENELREELDERTEDA
jgi:glutaredoxin